MAGPLDMSQDPDRFDATSPAAAPLDPDLDPDRFSAPGRPGDGLTLTELLGDGAQEQEREGFAWVFGLLGVLGFLLLFVLAVKLFGA